MARKQWRCFFCDDVFTTKHEAAEHFGAFDSCEADVPACKIAGHEKHLIHYIRRLEEEISRYRAEDSDVMRSIYTLEADHRQALIRAEEDGYGKGVRDMVCPATAETEDGDHAAKKQRRMAAESNVNSPTKPNIEGLRHETAQA